MIGGTAPSGVVEVDLQSIDHREEGQLAGVHLGRWIAERCQMFANVLSLHGHRRTQVFAFDRHIGGRLLLMNPQQVRVDHFRQGGAETSRFLEPLLECSLVVAVLAV